MARKIPQIDKEITAIHRQMKRLEKIDLTSAASWQDAWDKHPDLHAQERALYRERGEAQQVCDAKATKEATRVARIDSAKFRKESDAKFKADRTREAASVDMLAALRAAFAVLQGDCGQAFRDLSPSTWRKMEAAIEKAKGQ